MNLRNLWDSFKNWWSGRGQPTQPTQPPSPLPPPYRPPVPFVPLPPPAFPTNQPPVDVDQTVAGLLAAHNQERRANGQPELTLNNQLLRAAQRHASWMAQNRDMDHNERPGPGYDAADFFSRIQNEGYQPRALAENIAAGQSSIAQVMREWLLSPSHRASMLSSTYKEVGFGVAQDTFGHIYWAADFASPVPLGAFALISRCVQSTPPALVRNSVL